MTVVSTHSVTAHKAFDARHIISNELQHSLILRKQSRACGRVSLHVPLTVIIRYSQISDSLCGRDGISHICTLKIVQRDNDAIERGKRLELFSFCVRRIKSRFLVKRYIGHGDGMKQDARAYEDCAVRIKHSKRATRARTDRGLNVEHDHDYVATTNPNYFCALYSGIKIMALKLKPSPSPPPFQFENMGTEPSAATTPPANPPTPPTVWISVRDMHIYGSAPLRNASDIGIVQCNDCTKAILRSALTEHAGALYSSFTSTIA